jgi:hypothetical protein
VLLTRKVIVNELPDICNALGSRSRISSPRFPPKTGASSDYSRRSEPNALNGGDGCTPRAINLCVATALSSARRREAPRSGSAGCPPAVTAATDSRPVRRPGRISPAHPTQLVAVVHLARTGRFGSGEAQCAGALEGNVEFGQVEGVGQAAAGEVFEPAQAVAYCVAVHVQSGGGDGGGA